MLSVFSETTKSESEDKNQKTQHGSVCISDEETLVEIKSFDRSHEGQGKTMEKFLGLWDRPCTAQVWSNDPKNRKVGPVKHYHWKTALKQIFRNPKK